MMRNSYANVVQGQGSSTSQSKVHGNDNVSSEADVQSNIQHPVKQHFNPLAVDNNLHP